MFFEDESQLKCISATKYANLFPEECDYVTTTYRKIYDIRSISHSTMWVGNLGTKMMYTCRSMPKTPARQG